MTSRERVEERFVSALVLAAGSATRMGKTKQLLPLAGRPVLQHVLEAAGHAQMVSEIVLVIGADADRVRTGIDASGYKSFKVVVNDDWSEGMSTSLITGVRAADPRACAACILLGDQPSVTAASIDRVVEEFLAGEKPVVRPVYRSPDGGVTPGHPVLISREMWPEIKRLRGDEGMRAVISAHPDWMGSVTIDGEAPPDIDDERDYARVRLEYEHR